MMLSMSATVNLMLSDNYKDRFIAEYRQTKIRYNKLSAMVEKYENGELEFKPTCPLPILQRQQEIMEDYLELLETRAQLEEVDLEEDEKNE